MNNYFIKTKKWHWLIIIVLAASLFRLTFLDLAEFKTDQAYLANKMAEFYSKPEIFWVGLKSSVGTHSFPLTYYLFILLTLPSRDPLVLIFMIALINVIAIAFFYLMVKKYYGNFVGVISALLLSLSPWTILYSRQIWTPDLIIPLSIPFFYFLHKLIIEKRDKYIFWVSFSVLILLQGQPIGMFLFISLVITLLILRVRINLRYLILGIALGLIPAIPFFIYQFSKTPLCPDCFVYLQNSSQEKDFSSVFFTQPLQMINALSMREFVIHDWNNFTSSFPLVNPTNLVQILLFPLLLLGIFYILKSKRRYIFLVLITLITALLLTIARVNPAGYYELIVAIPIFIIYGLAFEFLNKVMKSKFLSIALISIILVCNIIFEISFYKFLNDRVYIYGQYGPIYRYTDEFIRERLAGQENNKNFESIRIKAMFDYHNDLNPEFKELYVD